MKRICAEEEKTQATVPVPEDKPAKVSHLLRDYEGEPLGVGHWSEWRNVAKAVLKSTARDRQHAIIGEAFDMAPALFRAASERLDQTKWSEWVTEIFWRFVAPNILKPLPEHLTHFMWGLLDDDYAGSFAWTMHDDEAVIVRCIDLAVSKTYRPYMMDAELAHMGLDVEGGVTSEEAMLFLETRIFPWASKYEKQGLRDIFTAWHQNLALEGGFDHDASGQDDSAKTK
jgi:hypothetical protein